MTKGRISGSLEEVHKLASARGGKFLSGNYRNSSTKYSWQCMEGHTWEATAANIRFGRWCPICRVSLAENICRLYFETIFNKPFPKKRPGWLRNSNGNLMELDGFNKELMIAFEHQGAQHYRKVDLWKTNLAEQQKRDAEKLDLCKKNNVKLIVIPRLLDKLSLQDLQNYLKIQFIKKSIALPDNYDDISFEIGSAFKSNKLKSYQELAIERGGKLISKNYLGALEKLEWECRQGHRWFASPNSIKNAYKKGTWCPHPSCASYGVSGPTYASLKRIAENKGGELISTEYINNATPLKWKCKEGHIWEADSRQVYSHQSWCRICFYKSRSEKNNKARYEKYEKKLNKIDAKLIKIEKILIKNKYRFYLHFTCKNGHRRKSRSDYISSCC